jgi:hypothetical protein
MDILEMEVSMMIWLHSKKCCIKDLNLQLLFITLYWMGYFMLRRPVAAMKMFHEIIQSG